MKQRISTIHPQDFHRLCTLLIAVWCFERVSLDCHGNPEEMVLYRLEAASVTRQDVTACCDEAGKPYLAPVYTWHPYELVEQIQDPVAGNLACSSIESPTPGIGDFSVVRVLAEDRAGNRSDASCP